MSYMGLIQIGIEAVFNDRGLARGMNITSKAMHAAAAEAARAETSFHNLAGAFTGLIVAQKVKAIFAGLIDKARKMNLSMARLAYLSGRAGNQLQGLRKAAESAADATIYSPQQMTDMLGELYRASGDIDTATQNLASAGALAMASFGSIEPKRAAVAVGTLGKVFGQSASEVTLSLDKMAAAGRRFGMGVEDYTQVLSRMRISGILAGQDFDEVLKFFTMANSQLREAKRTSTQMIRLFSELGGAKGAEVLGSIGVFSTKNLEGNLRPVSELLGDIYDRWRAAPVQVMQSLRKLSVASQKPLLASLSMMQKGVRDKDTGKLVKGRGVLKMMSDTINAKNAMGELGRIQDAVMGSSSGSITRMTEAWTTLQTVIGEGLLQPLGKLAKEVRDLLVWIRQSARALPQWAKYLLKMAGGVIVTTAVFFGLKLAIGGVGLILKSVAARLAIAGGSAVRAAMEVDALSIASLHAAGNMSMLGKTSALASVRNAILSRTTISAARAMRILKTTAAVTFSGFLLFLPQIIEKVRDWAKAIREVGDATAKLESQKLLRRKGSTLNMFWNARNRKSAIDDLKTIRNEYRRIIVASKLLWFSDSGSFLRGQLAKQYLQETDFALKRMTGRLTLEKKVSSLQKKQMDQRVELQKRMGDYFKSSLVTGSKPFSDSVKRLAKLLGQRQSVIKGKALMEMGAKLLEISQSAGKYIGNTYIKPGEAKDAGRQYAIWQSAMKVYGRQIMGKKVSGKESKGAFTDLIGGSEFLDKTVPGRKKLMDRIEKGVLQPYAASLSSEGLAASARHKAASAGRIYASGTNASTRNYDASLGRVVTGGDAAQRESNRRKLMSHLPKNTSYVDGGRGNLGSRVDRSSTPGLMEKLGRRSEAEAITKSRDPKLVKATEDTTKALKDLTKKLDKFHQDTMGKEPLPTEDKPRTFFGLVEG